jgi:hypothetical protein
MTNQKKKNLPESTQENEDNGIGLDGFIVFILIVYGGLFLIDRNFVNIPQFDKVNNKLFKEVGGFFKENKTTNSNNHKSNENINNTNDENLCSKCNGHGFTIGCTSLSCKNGYKHCQSCNGKSIDDWGRTCLNCQGRGLVICNNCQGDYTHVQEICDNCYGKKYTRKIVCSACKGQVLKEGDSEYVDWRGGTHCIWCGGSGMTEEALEGAREEYLKNETEKALNNAMGGS